MSYIKQNFEPGNVLTANELNIMSEGIASKQDALYSGLNIKTLNGISLLGSGDIAIEQGTLVDKSKIIYTNDESLWERKTISASGLESTTNITQSNIMSSELFVQPVYLTPKGDITYAIITYNSDGSFKARSEWFNEGHGIKMISDDNPFNILVATGESNTDLPISDVLKRFVLQNFNPEDNVSEEDFASIQKQIDYATFLQACDFPGMMVHYSCDDTWECLYELTQKQDTYNSIFDCTFFNELKKIHDASNACFTLNTFNTQTTTPDYDISNVPSKFQNEFQENKSWLKFAFHAECENTYYINATGATESYNKFVEAIYKLTGDYECIDRITRLGFFSCNLDNALAFKNCNYGIIGLLSADDTRVSYYLTSKESEIARLKGKYIDTKHELIFIKTLNRGYNNALNELQNNPMYNKTIEFFWHEYEKYPNLPTWLATCAAKYKEAPYIQGFPSNIYANI